MGIQTSGETKLCEHIDEVNVLKEDGSWSNTPRMDLSCTQTTGHQRPMLRETVTPEE